MKYFTRGIAMTDEHSGDVLRVDFVGEGLEVIIEDVDGEHSFILSRAAFEEMVEAVRKTEAE